MNIVLNQKMNKNMKWNKVSEKELPFREEVIAFNEKWIDEDFNPNGTRVGFIQDDVFISATWNDEQDCYDKNARRLQRRLSFG